MPAASTTETVRVRESRLDDRRRHDHVAQHPCLAAPRALAHDPRLLGARQQRADGRREGGPARRADPRFPDDARGQRPAHDLVLRTASRSRTAAGTAAWSRLSTDGGATWTDIGTARLQRLDQRVTAAPIGASRPAFVNRMVGWPNFATVTLNLGTTFANQECSSASASAPTSRRAPRWDVDDIAVTGSRTPRSRRWCRMQVSAWRRMSL